MKLKATLELHAPGDVIHRDPRFWDKVSAMFGGRPNLQTNRVRTHLETAALLDGAKKALERLGLTNAIALVIDGQVLFEDRRGAEDDFADLFLAFYENEAVYGRDFRELRVAVEHAEGGLHYVIEIIGAGEHKTGEPTARILVASRIQAFTPAPGEPADAFRARLEPLLASPAFVESHRLQFEAFVTRLEQALHDAMPDLRVSAQDTAAAVERPDRTGKGKRKPAPVDPRDRRYDPYERYHPSAMDSVASMVLWGSLMSWAWHPHYVVVSPDNTPIGATDALVASDSGALDVAGGDALDAGVDPDALGQADSFDDGGFDEGGDLGVDPDVDPDGFDFDFFDF